MLKVFWKDGRITTYLKISDFNGNVSEIEYIEASDSVYDSIIRKYCVNLETGPCDRNYTIPVIKFQGSMVWYGDIARTIVLNFKNI